jgi:UDP-glucose 4-epimerase
LLLEGKSFEVWDGPQLRDFTYVDDAVEALLLAGADVQADGQVFNLGGPPPVSLAQLAATLVKVHGTGSYEVRAYPSDRKKIDIGDFYADFSKARRVLGWDPQTDLETALRRTLDYYGENIAHYS